MKKKLALIMFILTLFLIILLHILLISLSYSKKQANISNPVETVKQIVNDFHL